MQAALSSVRGRPHFSLVALNHRFDAFPLKTFNSGFPGVSHLLVVT
jgi:hypothetical protein